MEETKPKRVLSPEALEKLAIARKKALEAKKQDKEITKYEKEQARAIKQSKREQTYQTIMELKQKQEEPKEEPKEVVKKKVVEQEPEIIDDEEEEEEEVEDIYKEPPKKQTPRTRPQSKIEPSDEELYTNANIEMLRKRLYQQTRQRLANDLFGY